MKKILSLLWLALLLSGQAQAQSVLQGTTNTATSASDLINVDTNAPWGVTANGRQARFKLNNDGSLAVSGTVQLTGTAAVADTNTAATYLWLTLTAAGMADKPCGGVTFTNVTYYAQYSLTFTAGFYGPVVAHLSPGIGPAAAFYYDFLSSSAREEPTTLFSVSTTPMVETFGPGWFLAVSPTGAGTPVTFSAKLKLGCIGQ